MTSLFLYTRHKQVLLWKEMTNMSNIGKFIVNLFVTLIMGAISVIGMLAGFTIWENGLGNKVAGKTRKLFKDRDA